METNTTTAIDLRPHPLDPARIGPEGLVALLVSKFEATMHDPAVVRSYSAMTKTLVDVRDRDAERV